MASASLVFWLVSDSFSRSQRWNTSTSGRLRCCPTARAPRRSGRGSRLDPVEGGDARQGFGGDRRGAALGEFVKVPTDMAPAEGKLHIAPFGQHLVAAIPIDLQHAAETGEVRNRPRRLAVRGVDIRHN